jgi:phosphoribosyl-dephospho-CoA transferase
MGPLTPERRPRPHDLVRARSVDDLRPADAGAPRPAWVPEALTRGDAPWAVVRRGAPAGAAVLVGVRGATRSERWAAELDPSAVLDVVRPVDVPRIPRASRAALPVFTALTRVAPLLDAVAPGAWGPVGSGAYELATGIPVVRDGSDLDLVIDAPTPLDAAEWIRVVAALRAAAGDVRADVQVLTPHGGFALDEWARAGSAGVALRTDAGPRLVADPWASPAGGGR